MKVVSILILSLFPVFFIWNCNNYPENYKPSNLNEALNYLDFSWSKNEKKDFREKQERDAVIELHVKVGRWIRNNWINGNGDTNFLNYFHKLGIQNPDDISSIILTSFHRKLNGKDLDINRQVEFYKKYWKPIYDCENKIKKQALLQFNRFSVGSPIHIFMKVDTSKRQRNAVILECPDIDWIYDSTRDLEIIGIVTDKYFIGDSSNVFFKVKIGKMNYKNTAILMENVNIGDNVQFSLKSLLIK